MTAAASVADKAKKVCFYASRGFSHGMRVALLTNLGSTLGRMLYAAMARRIEAGGWTLVRDFGLEPRIEDISRKNTDVLVVGIASREQERALLRRGVRLVNFTNRIDTPACFQVVHDQGQIGRMAAEFLLRRGYRTMGVVGYADSEFSRGRVDGFVARAREAGAAVNVCLVDEEQVLGPQLNDVGQRLGGPDAIYAVNDFLGLHVIQELRAKGLRVPEEVAVMGTDHEEMMSVFLGKAMTSVVLDYEGMGRAIGGVLERLAVDLKARPERVVVAPLEVFPGETATRSLPEQSRVRAAWERLRGEDLAGVDVPGLARVAGMSERNFARCFKAETSQSPGAALLEARMNLARRLLTGSEEGIDRIAERCGYADRHQFTTRFHAEVKTTPAAYRRRSRFSRG